MIFNFDGVLCVLWLLCSIIYAGLCIAGSNIKIVRRGTEIVCVLRGERMTGGGKLRGAVSGNM